MRRFFKYAFLFTVGFCYGQSPVGFLDNYSGIQAISFNPAAIADNFYKVDVNILSGNFTLGSNVTSVDAFKIIGDISLKEDKLQDYDVYTTKNNYSKNSDYYGNSNVLGPSIMYQIDRENTIGFTTGIRLNASGYNLNTQLYELLRNNKFLDDTSEIDKIKDEKITGSGHVFSWAEVGFSYARVIRHTSRDILKVGATLKLLKGINSYSLHLNDFVSDFNLDKNNSENSTIDIDGSVFVSNSLSGKNYGQGLDIGFIYEKRNRTLARSLSDKKGIYYAKSPYSYKLSASITDIGVINYNRVEESINTVDLSLPDDFFDIDDYTNLANSINETKKRYILPTTAHLNLDYNISKNWFVNTNVDLFLLSTKKINQLKSVSNLTISPRYESLKFSAFLPISINRLGIFNAGLGFRTGYFFVGSSSLFNNLSKSSREGNFYMGAKIPILDKKTYQEFKNTFRHHR